MAQLGSVTWDDRGRALTMSSLVSSICLAVEDARREEEHLLWSAGASAGRTVPREQGAPDVNALFLFCDIQVRLLDRARDVFLGALREGPGLLPWEEVLSCRVLMETHFTVARSRLARRLPAVQGGGGAGPHHDVRVNLLVREMEGLFAGLEELYLVTEGEVPKEDSERERGG